MRWETIAVGEPIFSIFRLERYALGTANRHDFARDIRQKSARPETFPDKSDR